MSKRTERVVITPEGRVLKQLREKHGLSMRKVGEQLGLSDSYISQIENGRNDPPRKESLARFLKIYGGIGEKYFYEMCREWEQEFTDADFIKDNLEKLPPDTIKLIKAMVEAVLKKS